MIGQKNNKLTVVDFAYRQNGISYWICLCECGEYTKLREKNLKKTISCGCMQGKWPGRNRDFDDGFKTEGEQLKLANRFFQCLASVHG
jgi:hypothetical protein